MRLVYTKPVRSRILEILAYVASVSSEERANEVVQVLLDKTDRLLEHPRLGPPVPELADRGKGHRGLVVGRYTIVYYVVVDEIRITDFFDMKQQRSQMRG